LYKLLDTFCGAGGAGAGWASAGFSVTGIDCRDQPNYPFTFIKGDALEYLADKSFLDQYDIVHASPPCKLHTQLKFLRDAVGYKSSDEDYLPQTRELLEDWGGLYVIENVPGAPMRIDLMLCGTQFGLSWAGRQLQRHRWFESNLKFTRNGCRHKGQPWGVFGRLNDCLPSGSDTIPTLDAARSLMGISWMNWYELKESIPPVYTEFLGKQVIKTLDRLVACETSLLGV
jgi:DNA (cytosine-5)-methyltransferase 1